MPSSRGLSQTSSRLGDQRGLGLVEILVASALMGVGLVVVLGSLSTLLVGARTADRRTGEERLVRVNLENLMASPNCFPAPVTPSLSIDGTSYTVTVAADCSAAYYVQYTVTGTDSSGASVHLSAGRNRP